MKLIIASANLHKIREYRQMFKNISGLEVLSLMDFPEYVAPPEDGITFEDNASIKAIDAAKVLNEWVISDDSGLVVPALNGDPGVYSARYAGEDRSDVKNIKKLLQAMDGLTGMERAAYFECCIVMTSPQGEGKTVTGRCEGTITTKQRGRNGFGYDPVFIKHDYDKTFAELEENTKNKVSHRAKAFEKILPAIERLALEE